MHLSYTSEFSGCTCYDKLFGFVCIFHTTHCDRLFNYFKHTIDNKCGYFNLRAMHILSDVYNRLMCTIYMSPLRNCASVSINKIFFRNRFAIYFHISTLDLYHMVN